jgi:hypothetical protein
MNTWIKLKTYILKNLWILTFQKSTQMVIFINNDILNKNFHFHFATKIL